MMAIKRCLNSLFWLLIVLFLCPSCEREGGGEGLLPSITLDRDEPIYHVYVGEPLLLELVVENAGDNPLYRWTMEGAVVSEEATFTFVGMEPGSVYLIFEVIADHGQDEVELRVDVMPLKSPAITLIVPPEGFSVLVGGELAFAPEVNVVGETTFVWEVNGESVSAEKEYTFIQLLAGDYRVRFVASNSNGTDAIEFEVKVCTAGEMPFYWAFEQSVYSISRGRTVFLRPYDVRNAFDAEYTWKVNGQSVEVSPVDTRYAGSEPECLYAFTPGWEGEYTVEVVMKNSYIERAHLFTVKVCPPEGSYKRVQTPGSSAKWNRVYEFMAAPGQFVNENYTATTMSEACTYAEDRLRKGEYVSLGAFGGYIVVGFDHSIGNDGGYNIQISGNSYRNSSDPGIVWVMQDENGNGLPDDTWYELKGSEYGRPSTRLDYAVTYYRPDRPGRPVAWIDNEGHTGEVEYIATHAQDYYYPRWVRENAYTLVGRKLTSNTVMISPNNWINKEFEWGYADNFSPVDRLTEEANKGGGANSNHFKIDHAVRYDGQPANLRYIDFVKVQTGVNARAGWIGEVSTEVVGVSDYNMIK